MNAARQDAIDRLASAPARLAAAAHALEAAEAVAGPPTGEWTARQSLGHLCRVEIEVFSSRLSSLEGNVPPSWVWHEPGTADASWMATTETALAEFAARRAATVARLRTLDEAGWAKWGNHATFGRLDVVGYLGVMADHDDEHIAGMHARAGTGS
jgi:DinB superfamily